MCDLSRTPRRLLAFAIFLVAAREAEAQTIQRNAALEVMASDGATEAEATAVEVRLWKIFQPLLLTKGFALEPLEVGRLAKAAAKVPEEEMHAPGNSQANTALIVKWRELDVELVWMTVLSRDGGKVRLAFSGMGFHDLKNLQTGIRIASSIEALETVLATDAPALIDEALARFKPVPMPAWWRPAQLVAPPQTAVPPNAQANSHLFKRPRLADGAQVAVLDFKRGSGFSLEDARYLSDVVRAQVLKTTPRLSVMTRENLLVLLQASGKDLNECEGECEVDTGRRIGADAVISGDALKFGQRYKLSLRLHETKGGRLIAAVVASGATLEELDSDLQLRSAELLQGQE